MFIIEFVVTIAFLITVIGSLKLISIIEIRRQALNTEIDNSFIPYEELQFREEINSMSLEEIDEYFSLDNIGYEDAHSMIDDDYMQDHKEPPAYDYYGNAFKDSIPF